MRTPRIKQSQRRSAAGLRFLLSIFMLYSCAPPKPQTSATQYRFTYENASYRIRSLAATGKAAAYNELVGQNFLAADFDQDRVLDRIMLGEISLIAAQRIYDYGLARVTQEHKLRVRVPNIVRYTQHSSDFITEITSFRPLNAPPFNEFKVVDHRPVLHPRSIIMIDQNADGALDDVLKGSATLAEFQPRYAEVLAAGLQKGELIKTGETILVKEQ